jgi:hypothetical protein
MNNYVFDFANDCTIGYWSTTDTFYIPKPVKKIEPIKIELSASDLEIIRSFSDIKEVSILKDKLSILTNTINMSNHELGQYKIEIKKSFKKYDAISAIYICNQTRTVDVDKFHDTGGNYVFHHPHIWAREDNIKNTEICFGDIKEYIKKMLITKEPIILISTILEYLKNGYGWRYDKEEYLKCWPEVNSSPHP